MNANRFVTVVVGGLLGGAVALPGSALAAQGASLSGDGVLSVIGDGSSEVFKVGDFGSAVTVVAKAGIPDPDGAGNTCSVINATITCTDTLVSKVVVKGGAGNDQLLWQRTDVDEGDAGELHGEAGADVIDGGGEGVNAHSGAVTFFGGDQDDVLTGSRYAVLQGGAGNDVLHAGSGSIDVLDSGNMGDDTLIGRAGATDDFVAEPGADTYDANPGDSDALSYAARVVPVKVTLEGQANDGSIFEGDNADPELGRVVGGWFADNLDASTVSHDVSLVGGARDDVLVGGAGDDDLEGGAGADQVSGNAGDDSFSPGGFVWESDDATGATPGADVLDGGSGNDEFDERIALGVDGGVGDGLLGDQVIGGSGFDGLTVDAGSLGLQVSLDGVGNDGLRSGDASANVHGDIEQVTTFGGDDVLVGSDDVNRLNAGSGDDTLDGRGGTDVLLAGSGVDRVSSRDRAIDQVICGAGVDEPVVGDVGDQLDGCEGEAQLEAIPGPVAPVVEVPGPAVVAPGPLVSVIGATGTRNAPRLTAGSVKMRSTTLLSRRRVSVRVTVDQRVRVTGQLLGVGQLRSVGDLVLATATTPTFSGRRTLTLRLSKTQTAALKRKLRTPAQRKKGLTLKIALSAVNSDKQTTTRTTYLRIKG